MARPTKLTAAVSERIAKAISEGNYPEAAAQAAGIAASTYYRWMARGEIEGSGPHHEFREGVILAEAAAEAHAVRILQRAMRKDWRAALAYLERRHPSRWRRRQTTELVGKDGGPIRAHHTAGVDLTRLTDQELAQLEELVERVTPVEHRT